MNTAELMMNLILSVMTDSDTLMIPKTLDSEELKALYSLSARHDLAHIVGFALERKRLLTDKNAENAFLKQKMLSIYRREQIDFEEGLIFNALENASIPFLPLKGAIIKDLYPEKWMRTSCDIDVLVHEEDLEKAIGVIKNKLSYLDKGRHFHEHSLTSKSGVHLELHFNVTENIDKLDVLLERIWDYSHPASSDSHRFELSNEFLIFHNVAHMEYHFVAGGCGIRPFIDLWLMENKLSFSKEKVNELLNVTKSVVFYEKVKELISVWFQGKEHNETTEMMEEYILTGGVFGSKENRVSADIHKKGSKKTYIISRIFMPRRELESYYPNLKKRPLLLPFYEVKRWFRLLNKKGRTNARKELDANRRRDENRDRTAEMFNALGF